MSARQLPAQKQLKALSRVIHQRLSKAENVLKLAIDELGKIERELQERQGLVSSLSENIQDVLSYLSANGAVGSAQGLALDTDAYQRGLQRRYWLDYDRQREQYYLDLTFEEQKAQQIKVAEARSAYLVLKHKCDLMDKKLSASLRSSHSRRLARQDAERLDSALTNTSMVGTL